MTLYHVTRIENQIEKFTLDTEIEGGRQLGKGIYLSEQPAYWEDRLFAKANQCKWLTIEISDAAKIFNLQNYTQADSDRFMGWLEAEGWIADGEATPKGKALIEDVGDHNDALMHLKAQWLGAQGYDGLVDAPGEWGNNWVIWNLDLIGNINQVDKKYR